MAFRPPVLTLAPGETYPVELFVPSPTGRAWKGELRFDTPEGVTVDPDPRWTGRLPAWGAKFYPRIALSPQAGPGADRRVRAAVAPGTAAELTVRCVEPGLEVTPGLFKLTVRVTNPYAGRLLKGRIVLSNRERFLGDITTREFHVPVGQSQDLVFPLPGAAPVETEEYDFTFTVETYQGYRKQFTRGLKFPPHT